MRWAEGTPLSRMDVMKDPQEYEAVNLDAKSMPSQNASSEKPTLIVPKFLQPHSPAVNAFRCLAIHCKFTETTGREGFETVLRYVHISTTPG